MTSRSCEGGWTCEPGSCCLNGIVGPTCVSCRGGEFARSKNCDNLIEVLWEKYYLIKLGLNPNTKFKCTSNQIARSGGCGGKKCGSPCKLPDTKGACNSKGKCLDMSEKPFSTLGCASKRSEMNSRSEYL